MNVRSLLTLVLVFALVMVSVLVAQLNRQAITVAVPGFTPFSAPLWVVLFLTLLTGIFLALVYSLALTSREAMARWRDERLGRPERAQTARLDRGLRMLLAGEYRTAHEELAAITREDPMRAEAWLFGGTAARLDGDPDAGLEMHLRALGLLPGDPRVLTELSFDAEALGDHSGAVRYQHRLIETVGPTPERYRRVRDLHLGAGRLDPAIDAQREVVSAGAPEAGEAEAGLLAALLVERGRRQLDADDADAAIVSAREVLDTKPAYEPAHALVIDALTLREDLSGTLGAYEAAFTATRSLELLRRHANLLVDSEEPEQAIRMLRNAVTALDGSERIAARILLGRLYYRLELVDEAAGEFGELRELAESSPLVSYYQAKLHARRGESGQGYALMKEAVLAAGFLDLRYRCPECDTTGSRYGERCSDHCGYGRFQMDVQRDALPARQVEAPTV